MDYLRKTQLLVPFGPGAFYTLPNGVFIKINDDLNNWYKLYENVGNGRNCFRNKRDENAFNLGKLGPNRLAALLNLDSLVQPPCQVSESREITLDWQRKLRVPYDIFPKSSICLNRGCNCRFSVIGKTEDAKTCPHCKSVRQQLPYFIASKSGEASEVPWSNLLHKNEEACDSKYLEIIMISNQQIGEISCKNCNKKAFIAPLIRAYNENHPNENIMLVNASNAYCPKTISAINIGNELVKALARAIKGKKDLWEHIQGVPVQFRLQAISPEINQKIEGWTDDQIQELIQLAEAEPNNISIRAEEWTVLTDQRGQDDKIKLEFFSVNEENLLRRIGISQIVSVDKLEITKAFVGYSRLEYDNLDEATPDVGKNARCQLFPYNLPTHKWLPGISTYGEGIFIQFDENIIEEWENLEEVREQMRDIKAPYEQMCVDKGWNAKELSPRFLLIHTFAHLLIKQIAFSCGYSEASLSERLYWGNGMAGILIYTASGDGEGSLGGLSSLSHPDIFSRIVENALESAAWCSSDPVCGETMNTYNGSGAVCHNCCLLPETCCENFNSFLNRNFWNRYENYSLPHFLEKK